MALNDISAKFTGIGKLDIFIMTVVLPIRLICVYNDIKRVDLNIAV